MLKSVELFCKPIAKISTLKIYESVSDSFNNLLLVIIYKHTCIHNVMLVLFYAKVPFKNYVTL